MVVFITWCRFRVISVAWIDLGKEEDARFPESDKYRVLEPLLTFLGSVARLFTLITVSANAHENLKAIRFAGELLPNWAQLLDVAARLCPVPVK